MIEYRGRTVMGLIELASPNGKSLFLSYVGFLGGYLGGMPVLQGDDGIYRSVGEDCPVMIELAKEH
jgi:hypothetical protein